MTVQGTTTYKQKHMQATITSVVGRQGDMPPNLNKHFLDFFQIITAQCRSSFNVFLSILHKKSFMYEQEYYQ